VEVTEAYRSTAIERRLVMMTRAAELLKGGVTAGDKRLVFYQKVRGVACGAVCAACVTGDVAP
jgi:hypothetical protein